MTLIYAVPFLCLERVLTQNMYIKINDDILFREYDGYGYITDNSVYGYKMIDDSRIFPGEKYVSKSGAVMLRVLNHSPQDIDTIVLKLMNIFSGVDASTLKTDATHFYVCLSNVGFLSVGDTYKACVSAHRQKYPVEKQTNSESTVQEQYLIKSSDFLRSLHIEIASKCNERCVHCYIPSNDKTKIMSKSLFDQIIDEANKLNVLNITLSGGEPLLNENILYFLKKCRILNFSVNVLTNLTLLTENVLQEMKNNPLLCVQTSLYSMTPQIHDSITKIPGSFKKTIHGINEILEAGIPIQISCPIMEQNKETYQDVVAWGRSKGITVALEYVIFAEYDHSNENLKNRLSLNEIENLYARDLNKDLAASVQNNAHRKILKTSKDPICSICRYNLCISADGEVYPCVGWQKNVIGNLRDQSIQQIWKDSEKIKALRNITLNNFPKCLKCQNRGYCTICMMHNSNENFDGNPFKVNQFRCDLAAILHKVIDNYQRMH